MRLEKSIIQLLRDPYTFHDLSTEADCVYNLNNGSKYPIGKGIVRFIEKKRVEGSNKMYMQLYDCVSAFYSVLDRLYFQIFFRSEFNFRGEFLKELDIKDGDHVLEVSIGTGDNLRYLNKNAHYFGLDISYGMLKSASKHIRKWGMRADLFQGEAENLPFKDQTFETVFHVGGINFFNDKQKAITEMIRVAKSGAKIMISDETEDMIKKVYSKLPFAGKFCPDGGRVNAPVDLIPGDMKEISVREICKGMMYCITFVKP